MQAVRVEAGCWRPHASLFAVQGSRGWHAMHATPVQAGSYRYVIPLPTAAGCVSSPLLVSLLLPRARVRANDGRV